MIVGIIGAILDDGKSQQSTENKEELVDSAAVAEPEEPKSLKTWVESTSVDEMTDTKNIWKSLTSDNTVDFDFPYEGGSTLKISVRYMKKYGTDVLLQISKGQILCNPYNGNDFATIRFDNDPPQKFKYKEAGDGSADCVFLNNSQKFIKLASKAKKILVQIPIFQEGNPTFTFTVDEPLVWDVNK